MPRSHNPFSLLRPAAAPAPAVAGHRPLLLVVSLAAAFCTLPARAQSTGPQVVVGGATLQQQGQNLTVTTTNGAGNFSALNWQSFNVPAGSTTRFVQPSVASTSINRVVGPDPSAIFGTLSSNGRLVLVNPNGITVGAGAVVDTAGFTASTLRMTDADLLAGRLRFADPVGGLLKVDGSVLAREGDVVLIGSRVETGPQALVQSPQGATVLAAGQKVEVTGRGLEGIVFEVQAPANAAVNLGTLRGDAVGVFAGTLRHSGLVQAQAVSAEGGRVVLRAAGDASVAGGAVQAQALAGKGGSVDVLGTSVALTDAARVDASGAAGGGSVRIGGDYQGANAAVPNARQALVSSDSQVLADATGQGDGGRVIVWADDTTRAAGRLQARGGPLGGNGGFIETSGKRILDVNGVSVDASAAGGTAGTWLLDPVDITIVHGTLGSAGGTIAPGSNSSVTDATLNAALASNTNVLVTTGNGSGGNGDITFDGSSGAVQVATASPSLSQIEFRASRNITFANGSTSFSGMPAPSGGTTLQVALNAGTEVAGGAVYVPSGASLAFDGPTRIDAPNLNVTGGTVSGNGILATNSLAQTAGSIALGAGANLAVGGAFSSTGGTFAFNGAELAIQQSTGDLVIPGGTGSITATGSVSLATSGGSVTIERGIFAGADLAVNTVAGLQLNGPVVANRVLVQAGNAPYSVTQTGSISANELDIQTFGADVLLTNSGNAISALNASSRGKLKLVNNAALLTLLQASGSGEVTIENHAVAAPAGPPAVPPLVPNGSVVATGTMDTFGVPTDVKLKADGDLTVGTIASNGGSITLDAVGAARFDTLRSSSSAGGGNVTVTAASVGPQQAGIPARIEAMGLDNFFSAGGSQGGAVTVTSTAGDIALGSVITQGGSGSLGNGSGGAVTLAAAGGQVSVDLVRTDASRSGASDFAGNGGDVMVTTSGAAAAGKILLGQVSAQGALGGGSGGNVTIWGAGDVVLDASRVPSNSIAVSTASSAGAGPASSGSITVGSAGGNVNVTGSLESGGDASDGGSIGSITVSAAAAGKDVNVGQISAWAFPTPDQPAMRGGDVTITAGRDIVGAGIFTSGAGAGDGGAVQLTSGGNTTMQSVSTSGGADLFGMGGRGGAVTANAGGNLSILSISAGGGAGDSAGGAGGNISLGSSGGNVSVGSTLFASGGNSNGTGGDAGSVRITTTGAAASSGVTVASSIGSIGGNGSTGGHGGDVAINATGNVQVGSGTVSVLVQGGDGTSRTGDGGSVTIASTGGGVQATGVFQTFGGFSLGSGTPTLGGAGGSIDVRGATTVQLGNMQAWGAAGTQSSGRGGDVFVQGGGAVLVGQLNGYGGETSGGSAGGRGGSVTITSGGGSLTAQGINVHGGTGSSSGGSGGRISLAAGGGNITAGSLDSHAGSSIGFGAAGAAGDVGVSAGGQVSLLSINTTGGQGTTGSAGGSITVSAGGSLSIQGSGFAPPAINASGGFGSSGQGGGGGAISLASLGGNVIAGDVLGQGGFGQGGGATGSTLVATATNGVVGVGSVDVSGGSTYGTGATGGRGGDVTISAAGVTVDSIRSDGGSGGYSSTLGSAGGRGGAISVSATNGDLDLSNASIRARGGQGGYSDRTGGAGGQGGSITLTASGGVFTNAAGVESLGTELSTDGGDGGESVGTASLAGDHGGTGGAAGSILISAGNTSVASGASSTLYGNMTAAGGAGGSASNNAGALATGGTGGTGSSITVTVKGASNTLALGGNIRTAAGAGGLADDEGEGHGTPVTARNGSAGAFAGSFIASAPAGVFIPGATTLPTTGSVVDLQQTTPSLVVDGTWINNGVLTLQPGAWVLTQGSVANHGTLQLGPSSVFALGTLVDSRTGLASFTPGAGTFNNGSNGSVTGFGTIDGNLVNANVVSPGTTSSPVGILTVTGNYQQTATGRLVIDSVAQGPFTPGSTNDQLRVLGAVTLGGTLAVNEITLPQSQVALALNGPSAQQLAAAAPVPDGALILDTDGGVVAGSQFANITAPTSLRSQLLVRNGASFQTVDGLVVVAPPAPTPAPVPAPAPAVTDTATNTTDATLIDNVVDLLNNQNVSREVVQQALTEQQNVVTKFVSLLVKEEQDQKQKEDKKGEVITTTTSCKPS